MTPSWLRWAQRPKPYRGEDFARRVRFREDYLALAEFLLNHLEFDSTLDVGCANGFLLEGFDLAGKRLAGIDSSHYVREVLPDTLVESVQIGDFSQARGRWDLVSCVEVAEHIEPNRSRELVNTLTRLSRNWIYFTAAPPGQKGHGHINCRPHEEWLTWFAEAGWRNRCEATDPLREFLTELDEVPWLTTNSFLLSPVSSNRTEFELLTREGCHLCDEMAEILDQVLGEHGLGYSITDIDGDAALRERFNDVVPVLRRDGKPVAKVRVEREQLVRLIKRRSD